MRESFEGRLSGTLEKALTDNGINPNGGELGRITGVVLAEVQNEVELLVADPKELDKFRAEAKKKADAKAAAEKPAGPVPSQPAQTWRRRWNPPQSPAEKTDVVQEKPPAPPAPVGSK
jgi:hypothetical protein